MLCYVLCYAMLHAMLCYATCYGCDKYCTQSMTDATGCDSLTLEAMSHKILVDIGVLALSERTQSSVRGFDKHDEGHALVANTL